MNKEDKRPFWIIIDTKGILNGTMHMYRRFEYCKDLIILLLNNSPKEYIKYLKDRNYEYIISGENKIDLKYALDVLYSKYNIKTILQI